MEDNRHLKYTVLNINSVNQKMYVYEAETKGFNSIIYVLYSCLYLKQTNIGPIL